MKIIVFLCMVCSLAFSQGSVQTPLGIYNTIPPVLSNNSFSPFQLDQNGSLKVTVANLTIPWGSLTGNISDQTDLINMFGLYLRCPDTDCLWSNSTNYQVRDVAYEGNDLYLALLAGSNHQPSISPTYWKLVGGGGGGGGGGANINGYYLVNQATNAPVNAINLGALTTGLMKLTVSGSVATPSTATAGTDYMRPGQVYDNVVTVNNAASPYTIAATASYIICDATAGAVVINLPAATGTGREITVKKTDSSSNACTPTRAGSDTIDGATSYSLTTQYASSKVVDAASAAWHRSHVNQVGGALGGISTNATITGISSTQYMLPVSSSTAGQLGTSTTKLNGGVFYPTSDSTTAIQINKADGTTNVLTVNTSVPAISVSGSVISAGSAATDSATLGSELVDGTGWTSAGWTGSYPYTHTAGALQTGPTYSSGASACTDGTQAVTFTNGGGSGATGTITVSGGVPSGAVTITAGGSLYTSVPTTATIATCTGTATLTGGALDTRALSRAIAGMANNTYWQVVITISGRTAGTVDVVIGGSATQTISSTSTFGMKATGTGALTVTPTATFNGTVSVSVKQITAILAYAFLAKDSTGVASTIVLQQAATLKNTYIGGGGTYNTTGNFNSAIGVNALQYNTTGYSNAAIGASALESNMTGSFNSAFGRNALYSNTIGYSNSAMGVGALYSNTIGNSNTAIGLNALQYNTTGNYNSAVGLNALYSNTTGYSNSAIGASAGRYAADGSTANATSANSVYLGYDTRANASGDTNEIAIGYQAIGFGSNTAVLGNSSIASTMLRGNVTLGNACSTLGATTLTVQNCIAAGTTRARFIAGAGDASSDHLLSGYLNDGTTEKWYVTRDGTIGTNGGLLLTSDTGLFRNAAGVVEVNSGTAGRFADIKLRHIVAGTVATYAPAPTLTSGFGTGATIAGSDIAGRITIGTSPASSGLLAFGTAWGTAPVCMANNETQTTTMRTTPTTSGLSITGTMAASDTVTFSCIGY